MQRDSWSIGGQTQRQENIQALFHLRFSKSWWELLQFSFQCTPWKTKPGHSFTGKMLLKHFGMLFSNKNSSTYFVFHWKTNKTISAYL